MFSWPSSAPYSQNPPACAPGFSHGASSFAPAVSTIWPLASASSPHRFSLESCLRTTPWRVLLDEFTFHLGIYVSRLLSSHNNTKDSRFPFQVSTESGTPQHRPVGSPWAQPKYLAPDSRLLETLPPINVCEVSLH